MPAPSMKNGRFSEKNTGNRWFTSTWNASLSTWLKSGFTVASSVTVEVRPHFALRPRSPVLSDSHSDGVARSCAREYVAEGISSRVGRAARSVNPSFACFSNTHLPGSSAGQATETPMRLTRRQNRIPIWMSSPPLNRMVWSGNRISTA